MKYTRYKSFGWVIYRVSVEAGESFVYEVKNEVLPSRMSAQTIYTKGLCTGHYEDDPTKPSLDRVPGFANDKLPSPLPALRLNMVAQQDSEWWCISQPSNNSMPSVDFIRIKLGESIPVNENDLIFICEGEALINGTVFSGPKSIRGVNPGLLTATSTDVYGMKFSREETK